jgi:hypothetical protein
MYTLIESDWKTFRRLIPEWRERYITGINKKLLHVLSNPRKTQTDTFWDTKEKADKSARILRDCLDGHSRSSMTRFFFLMLKHNMITLDDLTEFSTELQEHMEDFTTSF